MELRSQIHKLEPGALVELFILDFERIGDPRRFMFYSGIEANYGKVLFQGNEYLPWPIKIEGIQKKGSGSEKRPKMTISNYNGLATHEIVRNYDLVGAEVNRIRTLSQFVTQIGQSSILTEDGVNLISTENANEMMFDVVVSGSTSNAPGEYINEMYFIEQKINENHLFVEFELSSALDFVGKKLPGRIAIANMCPWRYKSTENGSGCGWVSSDPAKWFDESGAKVTSIKDDRCGKRLHDCQIRFGTENELDYGGFPSLGRY